MTVKKRSRVSKKKESRTPRKKVQKTYERARKKRSLETDDSASDVSDVSEMSREEEEEQIVSRYKDDKDDDDESESEEEADNEKNDDEYVPEKEGKKKTTKKKVSSKKSTTQGSTPTKPKRTSKLVTGKKTTRIRRPRSTPSTSSEQKGRGRRRKEEDLTEEEQHPIVRKEDSNSLFANVRHEGASIGIAVDDWIKRYEENKLDGIAELMTFMIQSAGCMTSISEKDVERENLAEFIDDLYDHFEKVSDYPVISKHLSFRKFNANFAQFWNTLISNSQESILYDEFMLKCLTTTLTTLSSSNIRAFRHTATLAIYQVTDSLIDVITSLKKDLASCEKQLKAAKKKKNKSQEKELSSQCETYQEHIEQLDVVIQNIFVGVFHHRSLDTVPDIRALSIVSLGGWIQSYPDLFLSNEYLRYLGWSLSDKDPQVRETSLKVLNKLYNNDEWIGNLSAFTNKFLPRFVEMTEDINIAVSDEAIKLLTVFLRHGVLQENKKGKDYIEDVSALVFDQNASVRHYAAKFVFYTMAKKMKKKGSRDLKQRKTTDIEIDDLLEFIREKSEDMPSVSALVVDAFWNLSSTFKQWEDMCNVLIEKADDMAEEDSLNLVRILNSSVKKLCGKLPSTTSLEDTVRIPKSKKKSEDKENEKKELENMTVTMAKALPKLISKYASDKDKVEELIEIPQYLDLNAYTEHQIEHDFKELLSLLKDVFWKHTEPSIFKACALTFKHFMTCDFALKSKAEETYNELLRDIETKLRAATDLSEAEEESQEDSHKFSIQVGMQRIEQFVSNVNVVMPDLYNLMTKLIEAKIKGATDITTCSAISVLNTTFMYILWRAKDLMSKKEIQDDEINTLFQHSTLFSNNLITFLDSDDFDIAKNAFLYLCDLFVTFSPHFLNEEPFIGLRIRITDDDQEHIADFFDKAINKICEKEATSSESPEQQVLKREKQTLVSAVCKAIIHGQISEKLPSIVFSHYLLHDATVTEAIRYLYSKVKHSYPEKLHEYEYEALMILFEKYLKDQSDATYERFVELVNRFSKSHFPGKDTKHVSSLLFLSISQSFEKINQLHRFLPGLSKYITRLDESAAEEIKQRLDEKIKEIEPVKDDDVRNSIDKFQEELDSVINKKQEKNKKKSSKRKREEEQHEEDQERGEQEQQEDEDVQSVVSNVTNEEEGETAGKPNKQRESQTSTPVVSRRSRKTEGSDSTPRKGTKRQREQSDTPDATHRESVRTGGEGNGDDDDDDTQISDEDIISEGPSKKQKTQSRE